MMKRVLFAVIILVALAAIYGTLILHRKMAVNHLLGQVFSPGADQGMVLTNLEKMGAKATPIEAQALSQTGSVGDAAELALLNNPDAADALGTIVPLLNSPDSRVRQRAASVVAQHIGAGDTFAIPTLIKALNDTNEYVAENMAGALGKFSPSAGPIVSALTKALDNNSARVRIAVAQTLSRMDKSQNPIVLPVLKDAVVNGNARDRHWAAVYLHQIDPANLEVLPVFISSLTNEDSGVRSSAAYSLLPYGPKAKDAVPALVSMLKDPDPETQTAARSALENIDPSALKNGTAQTP